MFIKPCEGRITSPFGWRIHPISNERQFHKGLDLAQKGTVGIHAAADGVVRRVGPLGTYGNIIIITHRINGKTYETNHAHLRSGLKVVEGQHVKQGQLIAYMGNTGGSAGQHLHFEIHAGRWETGQPNAVDPLLYLCFPEVLELQKQLNKLGYKLTEDGINEGNTEGAVKDFQTKSKLVADGNAGPATLKAMAKVITKPAVTLKKEVVVRMLQPSTETLKDEVVELLELAHKSGILSSDSWAKAAKAGTLSLDDAVALNAAIMKRALVAKEEK